MKVGFDGGIKLEFHGAKVTSDGGLLAFRDLDDALGLFNSVSAVINDKRTGRNIQHAIPTILRQSIYSRLAEYEDVNDAGRLSWAPWVRIQKALYISTMVEEQPSSGLKKANMRWTGLGSHASVSSRIRWGFGFLYWPITWVTFWDGWFFPKNQTLVSSQPPRKAHQDRSKGCRAQQIYNVSDGWGGDRQGVVCRDSIPDRTIALLFCLTTTISELIQWIRVSHWQVSAFIPHIFCKNWTISMQKILVEKLESDNIWLLMRLLRILTAHNFDMGNVG